MEDRPTVVDDSLLTLNGLIKEGREIRHETSQMSR
jgi:hypothetical protein